ncbi:hypothetical protein ACS0TY_032583 [Phlomoides rotata]
MTPPIKNTSCPLAFDEEDLMGVLTPHNDPLVISVSIMGTNASTYNSLLGRPFITKFKAAVSTYYYCVKFPTLKGTVSILEQDPSSGQNEHGAQSDRSRGEEADTSTASDDLELITIGEQGNFPNNVGLSNEHKLAPRPADTPAQFEQEVVVDPSPTQFLSDIELHIRFEPMEIENDLSRTGPIIDPRWKDKKKAGNSRCRAGGDQA